MGGQLLPQRTHRGRLQMGFLEGEGPWPRRGERARERRGSALESDESVAAEKEIDREREGEKE